MSYLTSLSADPIDQSRFAVADFAARVQQGDSIALLSMGELAELPTITTLEEFEHFTNQLSEMRRRIDQEHPRSLAMAYAVMLRLSEFLVVLYDGVPSPDGHCSQQLKTTTRGI